MSATSFMRALRGVALVAAASLPAAAQGPKPSAACRWSANDPWVKRQAEFFDESKHDWTNDTLRNALLAAANITAPLKAPVLTGVEIAGREPTLGPTAEAMAQQLKKLAAVRGSWPGRSAVGAAGTHAIYLIAQRDTGLARAVLHQMMEAGPAESPAIDVATFEDHMRLVWGRKQLYGTQFRVNDKGAIELAPMEDSTHADLRREDAGLPPFKLGMCLAKAAK